MSRDVIRSLEPIPFERYSNLPLNDLAAYALLVIERQGDRLTIENICVAMFRLFPEKFSLIGFPEYPDGMRVNRTLLHMHPKYENYAVGSAKKGYTLTTKGHMIAESIDKFFAQAHSPAQMADRIGSITSSKDAARTNTGADELRKLRQSELFALHKSGTLAKGRGIDFLALLGAFSHTPSKELRRKLKELQLVAKDLADQDLGNFLRECRHVFKSLLQADRS